METSGVEQRSLEQRAVHWRSVGLIGACVAGGLTLSMMVIGSAPTIGGPVVAEGAAPTAVGVGEPSTTAVVEPSSTAIVPDSTELLLDPTQSTVGAGDVLEAAAVPIAPAAVPATNVASPAQPAAALPSASPNPATPAAPAPTDAAPVTPSPATPPPSARTTPTSAPVPASTTPAVVTTSSAPTTAPPVPPTTAPPAVVSNITYPSYTVSGAASVGLQFDGSSIYVSSLVPEANWVYEIETNGPRSVEIKFFNVATGRDREFHAAVENGRIKVEN